MAMAPFIENPSQIIAVQTFGGLNGLRRLAGIAACWPALASEWHSKWRSLWKTNRLPRSAVFRAGNMSRSGLH